MSFHYLGLPLPASRDDERRRRLALLVLAGLLASLAMLSRGPAAADPPATFLYVHDSGTPTQVFAFQLNAAGQLQPAAGSPFSTGAPGHGCVGQCETIAFSPKQKLLFVTGHTGVSVFHVASDGSLSLAPGSPFGGTELLGVTAVDRGASTFVYAAEFDQNQVRGFRVQPDGSLVELPTSPFPSGRGPDGMTSVKNMVFACNDTARSISGGQVAANGSIKLAATVRLPFTITTPFAYNVNAEPSGKFLYAAQANRTFGAGVMGFRIKIVGGKLRFGRGKLYSPTSGNTAGGLALGKQKILFAIGSDLGGANDVQAMRRTAAGALQPLGSGQDSGLPGLAAGALDPDGHFLALVEESTGDLKTFSVNTSTGALTPAADVPIAIDDTSGILFARP
jgi:6-phosphogluconolactonase (cycloisomerase 2 family)